jgi:hypothetical protein
MTFLEQVVGTFAASLLVAAATVALARPLGRKMNGLNPTRRQLWGAVLLLPFFTPALLLGYVFARSPWAGAFRPGALHAFYLFMLVLKLTPVAVLTLQLLPAGLSPEAAHSARLHGPRSFIGQVCFRIAAAGTAPWLVGVLVFLIAFTEFELASLWNVPAWTVALFDAHAGGLALSASLRLVAWPAAVSGALLIVLFGSVSRIEPAAPAPANGPSVSGSWFAYLVAAAVLSSLLPIGIVASQAITGWASLLQTFALGEDLAASVLFACASSAAAFFFAKNCRRAGAALAWSLPGLCAALVLSLLLLAVFQLPVMRLVYDTPLPLLIALTLLLLPAAFLSQRLLAAGETSEALFAARLTGHAGLLWHLRDRRRFVVWSLLFCLAYFEFTASSILAPVGFTPVFVRLHNLMHYGQTAVLSAMLLAALLVPVAVLLLTGAGARLYAERDGR